MSTRVRTTCNRDCPDACGIIATVREGRVERLSGDPEHPITRGFLCYRTNHFLERQYDPDRLTSPLLRTDAGFREASWDEALDRVAKKMLEIRDSSGPAAILNYRSGGSLGVLKGLVDALFERFGPVTVKSGDICSGAGDAAQLRDFGIEDAHDPFDLLASRTIILWGKNPPTSHLHLVPIVREARRRGARVLLIDPVWHEGAGLADRFLQVRPGGDLALGLGVARVLFERGWVDPEAASYCDHLEDLRRLAGERPVEDWASLADLEVADVELLARSLYERPAAILVGWGLQRRGNGSATVRMLDALSAISGNLGVPGGGVSFYFQRRAAFDLSFARGIEVAPRSLAEARLGTEILEARDPPIRMVFVTCGNPVVMLPDSATVARALRSRELTVVVDAFLTDTAREAHVVLPTTTMLEDDDLVGAYGHPWVGEVRPVVEPPAGVRTDYAIVQGLASRVGLGAAFSEPIRTWKARALRPAPTLGFALDDLAQGARRNEAAPRVLFADRKFRTPTGRVDLLHACDPTPPATSERYPYLLMAVSTAKAQGSQRLAAREIGPIEATVHPEASSGVAEGELARLSSEHGEMIVRVRHDDRQRRDLVLMAKGGWWSRGRAANALIAAALTDDGGGAVYYDTPVRLDRLEAEGEPA